MTVATLLRRQTADGLVQFRDDIPLGKTYVVDETTRRMAMLEHRPTGRRHRKELICASDGTWLPVECLLLMCDEVGHG